MTLFSQKAPVIVLSAKSGLDSKVEVLSAGAEDYLCKPLICRNCWCGYRCSCAGAAGEQTAALWGRR